MGLNLDGAMTDAIIDPDQATLAQVYLRAMATAIEAAAHAARPEDQRPYWLAYRANEMKLHAIIPPRLPESRQT
jgi:hypothetical protein